MLGQMETPSILFGFPDGDASQWAPGWYHRIARDEHLIEFSVRQERVVESPLSRPGTCHHDKLALLFDVNILAQIELKSLKTRLDSKTLFITSD